MIENLGMPYMGSKRKLAPKLIKYILEQNPNCKYFYDLFGGGGAMSFYALQVPQIQQVFYNELNTGVVELLRKIRTDGVTDEFYQWIDRETFNANKNNSDWFGGLCKVVWSFGNSQTCYLFGKDKEPKKKLLHQVIVDKCEKSANEISEILGLKIIVPEGETINERRLNLQRWLTKEYKDRTPLKPIASIDGYTVSSITEQLEQLQQLKSIACIEGGNVRHISEHLESVEQLERLEQLDRLEQIESIGARKSAILQNLERTDKLRKISNINLLEQLQISNLSYADVKIATPIEETVIYLDPPYNNTKKYEFEIDHDELTQYIQNSSYKIYLSSYEFESMYECKSFSHRTSLSATANNKVVEKLFCNREEKEFNLFNN